MEIWSGDNFTGNRAECTAACDINRLGSVGNDRTRSARCTCGTPATTTTRKLKTNTFITQTNFSSNTKSPSSSKNNPNGFKFNQS